MAACKHAPAIDVGWRDVGVWKNQLMAGQSTTTTREPAAVWRSPPLLAVWAGTWGGRSGHMRHPAAVAKTPTGGAERAATAPKHSAKARHNTQNNRRQCVRAASSYCAEKTTAGPARAVGCPRSDLLGQWGLSSEAASSGRTQPSRQPALGWTRSRRRQGRALVIRQDQVRAATCVHWHSTDLRVAFRLCRWA